jgi:hypothetical protein
VPEQPVTIHFPDNTQIPVLRAKDAFEQERLLRPLVERCSVAAFGVGRKTRYDSTVRDALQIKAEGGAFSVLHFDPAAAGILEQIRRELAPYIPDALTAELYNLNVYGRGGHFVPHKDTPRGSDMLGTLVVCLPAQFSNGAFVVKHHGVFQTHDWGEAIREQTEPTRMHWAAFFWVDPPPHFNGQPTMYPEVAEGRVHAVAPDLPALIHLHACEYSATGYFGNEGSDIDLYIYCALHVAIPRYGEGARAVARTKPFVVSSSAPRGQKKRG